MISDRAKKLVEALQSWRDLDSAYATAQRFLDEERLEGDFGRPEFDISLGKCPHCSEYAGPGHFRCFKGFPYRTGFVPLSEKIAQTRGQNGETE